MRVFTNSERSSFSCQQRWMWEYGLGFREALSKPHFFRGDTWHELMDVYHQKGYDAAKDALMGKIQRSQTTILDTESDITPDEQEDVLKQCALLLPEYHERYSGKWEVLHTEVELSACLDEAQELHYAGKVDKIVRCVDTGKTYIVDHKTTTMDLSRWYDLNHYKPQMTAYAMLAEETLGLEIDGLIYDVVRMPAIRSDEIPEPTKKGVLRKYTRSLPNITPDAWAAAMDKCGDYSDNAKDVLARLEKRAKEDCEMARYEMSYPEEESKRTRVELMNIVSMIKTRANYIDDHTHYLLSGIPDREPDRAGFMIQDYIDKVWEDTPIEDIAQAAHKTLAPSFPRNHNHCYLYNKECEYMSLCRAGILDREMRISRKTHEELNDL